MKITQLCDDININTNLNIKHKHSIRFLIILSNYLKIAVEEQNINNMTSWKSKGQSRKLENIFKKNKITFLLYMLEMPSHLNFNILKKNYL